MEMNVRGGGDNRFEIAHNREYNIQDVLRGLRLCSAWIRLAFHLIRVGSFYNKFHHLSTCSFCDSYEEHLKFVFWKTALIQKLFTVLVRVG